MKKCEYCGAEFSPRNNSQRFCTPLCGVKAKKKTYPPRDCVICGVEFIPLQDRQMTCGKKVCSKAYYRRKIPKYQYLKPENEKNGKARKKKRYTVKEWEQLTPSQRWELMTWAELSAELARLHLTYGQGQVLKDRRELPFDFGEKRG